MHFIRPTLPDYDPLAWQKMPFSERARLVCQAWALQGYGTPFAIYLVYAAKVAFYIAAWIFFCGYSPSLGSLDTIATWWCHPIAFQKAILWSLLFEILGLGCGSGPLTGRYLPPVGGFLYFLRPGTVKLPLFPKLPILGQSRRSLIDVLLYLALIMTALWMLVSPTFLSKPLLLLLFLLGLLTLSDKTLFLAARGEHYIVTLVFFLIASNTTQWLAGAKGIQVALWFFAGFSKLNHHFATVVCVMISNSPVFPFPFVRKWMYRDYPHDLRPSQLASWMGHFGTALEFAVPLLLLFAPQGHYLLLGMTLMLLLHGFITSNVPMGVPIEWNVLVVYGAFALFWSHPQIHVWDAGPLILPLLLTTSVLVPLLGNLFPHAVSFLPTMRYYAGNWAMSVWLFHKESHNKLYKNLPLSSPWIDDQLAPLYDKPTSIALVSKVMAFRLMHLHGRTLGALLPHAIDHPIGEYEWVDGEIVAGLTLGWNFGDGHLHNERLLQTLQESCHFDPGEVRCILLESQPLFRQTLHGRIFDAHDGLLYEEHLEVASLRQRQPWDLGPKPSSHTQADPLQTTESISGREEPEETIERA